LGDRALTQSRTTGLRLNRCAARDGRTYYISTTTTDMHARRESCDFDDAPFCCEPAEQLARCASLLPIACMSGTTCQVGLGQTGALDYKKKPDEANERHQTNLQNNYLTFTYTLVYCSSGATTTACASLSSMLAASPDRQDILVLYGTSVLLLRLYFQLLGDGPPRR
jgi:hypothetical protein